MILSGNEIVAARNRGEIVIEPFATELVNPNSYNFGLGAKMIEPTPFVGKCVEHQLTSTGLLLLPHRLYLGHTVEVIGSTSYVTTLLGRSSIGRLGLFLNVTADLGHCGSNSQWTLEMTVVQPLRIYPGMRIGQVAFWVQLGEPTHYVGRYHQDVGPQLNKDYPLLAE
jgi:dCTP deaminase